jgi:hypothetical protein
MAYNLDRGAFAQFNLGPRAAAHNQGPDFSSFKPTIDKLVSSVLCARREVMKPLNADTSSTMMLIPLHLKIFTTLPSPI